jgi:5-methyltetrahydropteroyltriglutamate--homocysteine methyltransferase
MSMQRSVDRIRTTHTGSLPRPPDMLETLHRLAAGQSVDLAAYESALTRHVADIVKRQVEAGIDTVSDGECSKPSFQHYVAERLAGFEPRVPAGGLPVPTGPMGLDGSDALMFPDFYRNVLEHNPFRNTVRMAPRVCVGPIRYVGHDKLRRDIENLKTAMVAAGADEGFMPASAPITALQNDYSQRKRNLSRLTVTPCERNTRQSWTRASSCRSISRCW